MNPKRNKPDIHIYRTQGPPDSATWKLLDLIYKLVCLYSYRMWNFLRVDEIKEAIVRDRVEEIRFGMIEPLYIQEFRV